MSAELFDSRRCELGEGAFWHPEREQAFWFDIHGRRLLSRDGDRELSWQFGEKPSAAGWIDRDRLLIATETGLARFDLGDGSLGQVVAIEADQPGNRSNDGRADPFGGFWIGTMAHDAGRGKGAIYRYYRGELRKLRANMSIPNAICFSPDGRKVYFADTAEQKVWSQALDDQGWPLAEPRIFLDLAGSDQNPDGAVTDDQGRFWNARWGSGTVTCHAPDDGRLLQRIDLPAAQVSCPAFIGAALDRMMVTSAAENLNGPQDGRTWLVVPANARGRPEPPVLIR
ncbi:Sugar lactone lactonase YvrE [Paracoccus halophilus]|uniref:Gluconolactonase n=1 Tax=Paracoccus halophilus TaxID=376733 RepID=A0A099F9C7_9RHOB|nr:SMP-30/gluconolactonase/LRE family protein [Paracoccus halophilus]KGJ06823.1 gluconolactonase [Paracoccus halophilus]SFA41314.1 Sugar lactone lactonase YvrE [Paracoccus halophilus]